MRELTAAVHTMDEIQKYFSGPSWRIEVDASYLFEAAHEYVSVKIELSGAQFAWRVEANEDPSDYDEGVSDQPVKAIAKFIGGPIPGGEFFEKMAFGPADMSFLLRRVATALETGQIGPRRAASVLRRARVLPDSGCLRKLAAIVRAAAEGKLESEEISRLKADMEKKGWEVKESESKAGMPVLDVRISDEFTASIEVDSAAYSYVYEFKDRPELKKEGVSDDPIRDFQDWYRTDEFKEATADRKEAKESRNLEESGTVPAGEDEKITQVAPQEAETVAPKKSA